MPLRGSRCVGDSPRKPLRHHREAATARDSAKHHREATPQRKARHHRGVTAGRETARLHREATPQRKARHLRESNLQNQQHRDAYPAAKQHREAAPQRKAKHHRDEQRAEPAASRRATCRTGIIGKQLPPGKAQSTIGKQLHSAKHGTTGSNCRQGNRTAPSGSRFTAQSKAPSGRATCRTAASRRASCEPAASRRATCRTSSIGKSTFWQIMVPNGQVLRGGEGAIWLVF